MPAVARINITEPDSVREWSTKVWLFNGAVRAAVTAVGNVAADVERHLKPAGNANADRAALREAFEGQKPSAVRPSSSGVALAGAEDAPRQPPR